MCWSLSKADWVLWTSGVYIKNIHKYRLKGGNIHVVEHKICTRYDILLVIFGFQHTWISIKPLISLMLLKKSWKSLTSVIVRGTSSQLMSVPKPTQMHRMSRHLSLVVAPSAQKLTIVAGTFSQLVSVPEPSETHSMSRRLSSLHRSTGTEAYPTVLVTLSWQSLFSVLIILHY
jgi:hypothetical protein